GPCRNHDVNLSLIIEKRKPTGAAIIQRAWQAIQIELEEGRVSLLERARRDLAQHDVFAFIERAKALLANADRDDDSGEADSREANAIDRLDEATTESMKAWDEALALAFEQRDEARLHKFRIATKRLRYRAELLVDLGQSNAKLLVQELKKLQQALGDWHDRCVLLRHVAEFIGRPNFLADHPDIGRVLLAEMEKEKLRNETAIDELMRGAAKVRECWARWKPGTENAAKKSES
ncbi:MAG: CHAD domain-containing protein, partial [Candidatus Binatia bacterium]